MAPLLGAAFLLFGGIAEALRPSDMTAEILGPSANRTLEERLAAFFDVPKVYCHATDNLYALLESGAFYGTTKAMKKVGIDVAALISHDNPTDGGLQYFINGLHGEDEHLVPGTDAHKLKFGVDRAIFKEAQTYFIETGMNKKGQYMSVATSRLRYGMDDTVQATRKGRGGFSADVRGVLVFSGWGPNDVEESTQTLQIKPPGVDIVGSKKLIRPYPYAAGALVHLKNLDLRAVIYDMNDALRESKFHNIDDLIFDMGQTTYTEVPDTESTGEGMLRKDYTITPLAIPVDMVDSTSVLTALQENYLDVAMGGHPIEDGKGMPKDSDGSPPGIDIAFWIGQGSDDTAKRDGLELDVDV